MISIYCEIGIFSAIASTLFGMKWNRKIKQEEALLYHPAEAVLLYFFTRLCPLLMIENCTWQQFLVLLYDVPVALTFLVSGLLLRRGEALERGEALRRGESLERGEALRRGESLERGEALKLARTAWVAYLLNPAVTLLILEGTTKGKLLFLGALAVFFVCYALISKKKNVLRLFANPHPSAPYFYVAASMVFMLLFFLQIGGETAQAFGVICVGAAILVLILSAKAKKGFAFVGTAKSYEKKNSAKDTAKDAVKGATFVETAKSYTKKEFSFAREAKPYTKKDFWYLGIVTLVAAILILPRLGATKAPESPYVIRGYEGDSCEMVLDLGEMRQIQAVHIFLGNYDNRSLSFSSFDEYEGAWIPLYEYQNISSVFAWNTVEIPMTTRYLGIVSMYDPASILELVLTDVNGNTIVPVNAQVYPELFDEQDLFPEHNSYYYSSMFDEVYHARTAYEILEGIPLYENTHPQNGKSLMALGVGIFGMNPFGWRIVCALFGIFLAPLGYLVVRRISGTPWIALVTSLFFEMDFMRNTLSRIGTIDIIAIVGILAMFYSFYVAIDVIHRRCSAWNRLPGDQPSDFTHWKKDSVGLLICGGITGLAIGCKWTALYALAGMGVFLLMYLRKGHPWGANPAREREHILLLGYSCVISFVLLPIGLYILSFLPLANASQNRNLLEVAYQTSCYMLDYHKGIKDLHPYMSPWYDWLINKQPLLDAVNYWVEDSKTYVSSVATFGNPVVWTVGTLAFLVNCYLWRVEEDNTARYWVVAFLAMLLPWLFIHRTVFIYQYFPCTVLMLPLTANALAWLKEKGKKCERTALLISGIGLAAAGVLLLLFYPEIVGLPVPADYINQVLEWRESWIFA